MKPFVWFQQRLRAFRQLPRHKKVLLLVGIPLAILLLIGIITTIVFAATLSSKESIMNRNKTGVSLLDRDGKVFYEFNNAHSDTHVPLDQIAPVAKEALLAAEDKDFYEHPGFSITGFVNAVWQNIKPGGSDGGGSTITQQLVKNALLTQDRNFLRKYQELVLSIEIERRYSKDEILEMYLNSAYFGEGAFGIEDAAKVYFGKSAKDLSAAEASMIIGVLPAPGAYSPVTGNPQYAKERQEYVLGRMQEEKYLTEAEADAALAVQLTYQPPQQAQSQAPHFALMVKEELEKRYGEEKVARSGYKVKTTISLDWQAKAEEAVAAQVDRLAPSEVSNGATVAIDPKTGEVLVLVGSRDWNNESFGKVNMTTATRQPGSSFKPIVYATGIEERSLTAATILHDKPTDFGGGYRPNNYDGRFRGDISVRRSLANSLNIPAVEAMGIVGITDTIRTAKNLGITTLNESPQTYGLSLALGSGQARLTEMTNAYATFANGGKHNDIQTILEITDKNDDKIFSSNPTSRQAISEQTSFIMSSMLSDNNARAEVFGSSLNLAGNRPGAVKTGTTEDYRDAWTVGYTPSLAIGVWIGNNDNKPMSSVAGASGSAPIWRQLMNQYLSGTSFESFKQPSGVVAQQVCFGTNAIAVNSGSNTFTEYFRAGSLPTDKCNTVKEQPKEPEKPKEEEQPEEEQEEEETTPPTEEPTDPEQPDDGETDPELPPDGEEPPVTTPINP